MVFDIFLSFLQSLAFVRVRVYGITRSQVAHLRVFVGVSYFSSLFAIDRSFSMTYRSSTYRRPTGVNKSGPALICEVAMLIAPFYLRL